MRRGLSAILIVGVLALVGFLLYRALSRYELAEITGALASMPLDRLVLAGCFAAASYLCLTGFDTLAVRYVGRPLAYRRTALASFTALSLGHNIGFAALSSGAVRYRFYRRWGFSVGEVAKVIVFCGVTVGLGLSALGGGAVLVRLELAEQMSGLQRGAVALLGCLLLAAPMAYLCLAAFYRGRIGFRRWSMESPPLALAVGQVVIGTTNFAMVAGCLHQTLTAVQGVDYATVASVYAIANATAIASHVPGGLGVIESVVLFLLPGAPVFAALIAFRVIYFFIPLAFGSILFAVSELALRDDSSQAERRDGRTRARAQITVSRAASPTTASGSRRA